jgi:hypothetical protein
MTCDLSTMCDVSSLQAVSHPQPFGGVAKRHHAALLGHLHRREECWVIREVVESSAVLSPTERPLACWIPCLIGMEQSRRAGRPFVAAPAIAHYIATSARLLLKHLPIRASATWLVGLTLPDQCAAYLIAILQIRRGLSVRPWWAPNPPERGKYLEVTTLDSPPMCLRDPHCAGVQSLVDEVQRASVPAYEDLHGMGEQASRLAGLAV